MDVIESKVMKRQYSKAPCKPTISSKRAEKLSSVKMNKTAGKQVVNVSVIFCFSIITKTCLFNQIDIFTTEKY